MSSAIMYKFRAGTKFEALSMPGASARLFDVKRAIVKAKKLDKSSGGHQLEFDLSVKNAMTHEEYDDESMLVPRGSRLIVQRLPAARGHGLLAKIERVDAGITSGITHVSYGNTAAADRGFYTIESNNGDEDEFVDVQAPENKQSEVKVLEEGDNTEKELAALMAVTDQAGSIYRPNTSISRSTQPEKFMSGLGGGGVPLPTATVTAPNLKPHNHNSFHSRANADPELREQELRVTQQQQQATKKRATGIPRTFLNTVTSSTVDAANSGEGGDGDDGAVVNSVVRLQPNKIGFEALVNRGGGVSASGTAGKRRELEYALNLTNTSLPEHLQCGICKKVAKNAMLISWDTEGRTACELCMRDGLAKSGFRCPLTGIEGVSPDDLHPNIALRKAVELFVQGVMKSMDEIVEQQEANEEEERKAAQDSAKGSGNKFEEDIIDRGVLMTKKNAIAQKKKRNDDFGDDDFGGDVFDVSNDVVEERRENHKLGSKTVEDEMKVTTKSLQCKNIKQDIVDNSNKSIAVKGHNSKKSALDSDNDDNVTDILMTSDKSKNEISSPVLPKTLHKNAADEIKSASAVSKTIANKQKKSSASKSSPSGTISRKEMLKNRGPPAGYIMGPAGGAAVHGVRPPRTETMSHSSHTDTNSVGSSVRGGGGGRGNYQHGRGDRGGRGNYQHGRGGQVGNTFFRGHVRDGGRFRHDQEPPRMQGGIGRGHRGGFGRGGYQNFGGRTGHQGWGGDYNGRGNFGGGNDFPYNQDGQQNGNCFNNVDQTGGFERNHKRPRSGSVDHQLQAEGRHEHPNRGQPDEHQRFHDNWKENMGRGRGFDQRGQNFDQRGRGQFYRRGPGRDGPHSRGRGGRGDFLRSHNGQRRGRF